MKQNHKIAMYTSVKIIGHPLLSLKHVVENLIKEMGEDAIITRAEVYKNAILLLNIGTKALIDDSKELNKLKKRYEPKKTKK